MNRIILTFKGGAQIDAPIQEDFVIEAPTTFGSFADFCPTIDSLVNLGNAYTGTGGTVTEGGLKLRSVLDSPRWQKTEPIKINTEMLFYTRSNAEEDVIGKVNTLLSLHILRVNPETKKIMIPGVNAKNVVEMNKEMSKKVGKGKGKGTSSNTDTSSNVTGALESGNLNSYNSIFSVTIPGVVYIEHAMLYSVEPTYSKHVTKKGFPIWASVRVQLQGLLPAFIDAFEMGQKFAMSETGTSTKDVVRENDKR